MRGLLGLLMAGSATMALAQETVAPPTITPPTVSAPATTPAPAPAASPGITFAPNAPVVQQAPPPAPPPESVRNPAPEPGATASATRTQPRRAAAPVARAAPAVVAPAAIAAPVNEVTSETPAAAPSAEVTPPPAVPAAAPEATAAPAQPEEVSSGAAWAILGLTLAALIGGLAWLIARRRRRTAEAFDYGEPAYVEEATHAVEPAYEPTYQTVEEPVPAAPVAAAAVASDPAARPWIDIGLRPIRAEADGDLEVELTVSNSGDADAHGVRVSTWMLDGARSSDNEQALIDARDDAQVATLDVATGDDRAVDTRLALPAAAATPLLVAEARYPLPDGGEGRIAAAFEIEANGDDTVEARLHEVLERA